jgi:hypothetical protein
MKIPLRYSKPGIPNQCYSTVTPRLFSDPFNGTMAVSTLLLELESGGII